jgi:hypothetical protein
MMGLFSFIAARILGGRQVSKDAKVPRPA